jgi:hypothetical protein
VKTPNEQIKQALLEQLESEAFQQELATALSENAETLGLSSLSAADLQPAALAFAKISSATISQQSQFIDHALSDGVSLLADVKQILEVELEGHFNRAQTPHNV